MYIEYISRYLTFLQNTIYNALYNANFRYLAASDGTVPGEASGKDLVACVDSVGADAVSGLRQDVVQTSRIPEVSIPIYT